MRRWSRRLVWAHLRVGLQLRERHLSEFAASLRKGELGKSIANTSKAGEPNERASCERPSLVVGLERLLGPEDA